MIYSYRVDILRNHIKIGEMNASDVQIHYDSTAEIKRSASITVSADEMIMSKTIAKVSDATTITFTLSKNLYSNSYSEYEFVFSTITDRLKPVVIINGVEYPQGIFMICSSPLKTEGKYSEYEFECYDETYILDQSKISDRIFIANGTTYIQAIENVLTGSSITSIMADSNSYVTHADREFSIGTKKIDVVNTLLSECNYEDIHTDENGYMHLSAKSTSISPKWIYRQNENSILSMQITKNQDIYSIPNVFVGVVTNPDVDQITAKKVNNYAGSPISTVNRGYELCEVYEFDDISTSAELTAYLNDKYTSSIMATETVSFTTAIDGSHNHKDQVQIETDKISGVYTEKTWDINFSDGTMTHTAERTFIA